MLTSFSLSNFKSFRKLDPIELRPLTVLCGINNSGKSTLLQSLLLMKQSNIAPRQRSLRADLQEPLLLNGPYVSLGDWADVISGHATEEEMGFSWKITGEVEEEITDFTEALQVEIDVSLKNYRKDVLNGITMVSSFVFRDFQSNFLLKIEPYNQDNYCLKISGKLYNFLVFLMDNIFYDWLEDKEDEITVFILHTKTDQKLFESIFKEINFEKVQVEFEGIWPTAIVISEFYESIYNAINKGRKKLITRKERNSQELIKWLDNILSNLRHYFKGKHIERKGKLYFSDMRKHELKVGYSYELAMKLLRYFWSRIRYLGPIREAPQRYYFLNDMSGIEMGNKGEGMPPVLGIEKDEVVASYYRCIYKGKQVSEYELRESDSLLEAVNWWLSEGMKLPEISDIGGSRGVLHQVKLKSSGVEVSLPDVGFGISQVLPVLVECLRSQPGDTIILEQPEIHLHPSLQSRLADFLICMAKSDKKLVIETHSEYMMNRFFLRIAQEDDDEIRKLFNPLFVSFDEGEQTSVVKPISINEFGEIENWPVGFFDQNDARELMAATLKKRTSKSKR